MITIDIPNTLTLKLQHLVLDLNGTLAVDGAVLPGVAARLQLLHPNLDIILLTANTHGGGAEAAAMLGIQFRQLQPGPGGPQKQAFVQGLGVEHVVAIGNGRNDALMLAQAALGIAVNGAEGMAVAALQAADLYVRNINDALDLLLYPNRLRATWRM
ncbi:MAG: HAD family hydrolase [Chloroflexi bacterium]|nr:HAD family hydrolase [Chloroflexota bacterium]